MKLTGSLKLLKMSATESSDSDDIKQVAFLIRLGEEYNAYSSVFGKFMLRTWTALCGLLTRRKT